MQHCLNAVGRYCTKYGYPVMAVQLEIFNAQCVFLACGRAAPLSVQSAQAEAVKKSKINKKKMPPLVISKR